MPAVSRKRTQARLDTPSRNITCRTIAGDIADLNDDAGPMTTVRRWLGTPGRDRGMIIMTVLDDQVRDQRTRRMIRAVTGAAA